MLEPRPPSTLTWLTLRRGLEGEPSALPGSINRIASLLNKQKSLLSTPDIAVDILLTTDMSTHSAPCASFSEPHVHLQFRNETRAELERQGVRDYYESVSILVLCTLKTATTHAFHTHVYVYGGV